MGMKSKRSKALTVKVPKRVIDFVGEGDAVKKGLAATRNGRALLLVGYGGKVEVPTLRHDRFGKEIGGNLVGHPSGASSRSWPPIGPRQSRNEGYRLKDAIRLCSTCIRQGSRPSVLVP